MSKPASTPNGFFVLVFGFSGGVASPCNGNFLVSWADTPNYYLERLGEVQLIDYIFPSLTGHLFGSVVRFPFLY